MDYAELYCKKYLKAVYHFCLKRTSNEYEAEELAGTINMEIIAGIKKQQPEYFEAWMWKVAKNCYSKWVRQKQKQLDHLTREEIDLQEIKANDHLSPEEIYVQLETLGTLRRELAFIKKEYRRILTFYYVDKQKVREIAEKLEIAEGTVKQRLHTSRKALKTNLDIKREFGSRSWAPEDMRYLTKDHYPTGYMLQKLRSKIITNIFLEANNQPLAREELANALGIAGPYLEDEMRILEETQLLKKVDKTRYITNFFIYSQECQQKIYQQLRSAMDTISPILMTLLDHSMEQIQKRFQNNDASLQQLRWFLLPALCDILRLELREKLQKNYNRTDGGYWALAGFEDHADLPEEVISTYNLCMPNIAEHVEGYLEGYHLTDVLPLPGHSYHTLSTGTILYYDCYTLKSYEPSSRITKPIYLYLLTDLFTSRKSTSELTITEQFLWEGETKELYAYEKNGQIFPKMLLIHQGDMAELIKILCATPSYQTMQNSMEVLATQIKMILANIHHPLLRENMPYYQCLPLNYMRMIAINDAIRQGWLITPKHFYDNQYAACFFLPDDNNIIEI